MRNLRKKNEKEREKSYKNFNLEIDFFIDNEIMKKKKRKKKRNEIFKKRIIIIIVFWRDKNIDF